MDILLNKLKNIMTKYNLKNKIKEIDNILECYNEKWETCGSKGLRDYYSKQIERHQRGMLSLCGFNQK